MAFPVHKPQPVEMSYNCLVLTHSPSYIVFDSLFVQVTKNAHICYSQLTSWPGCRCIRPT